MIYLTVRYPSGKTTYHTLKNPDIIIGRHTEAQLCLQDQNVSNYHARIFWENDQYWCEDGFQGQPSRNGTWVNGKRLTEAVPIEKGDTILIGACHILITEFGKTIATQEMPLVQGRESLAPEDFHALQLKYLEKKIWIEAWKMRLTVALLIAIAFLAVWIASSRRSVSVSVIEVLKKSPQNTPQVFHLEVQPCPSGVSVIKAPVTGTVSQIYRRPGDKVRSGDLLLELRTTSGIALVLSDMSGYVEAHESFFWEVGAEIAQQSPLCLIVDLSRIQLVFVGIPKGDVLWETGQVLEDITFTELPNQPFRGTISSVHLFDEKKAMEVIVDVPNPEERIRLNMEAFFTYYPDGFTIPLACLAPDGPAVYVVENGRCVRREVRIQKRDQDHLFIAEGLSERDLVVLLPPKELRDGQAVKMRNR